MAKKKAEPKAPKTLWVRISPDSNLCAGVHNVGPFENKVGAMSKKRLSRDWLEVDGTWASNLQESHLAHKFEFADKAPK